MTPKFIKRIAHMFRRTPALQSTARVTADDKLLSLLAVLPQFSIARNMLQDRD